MNWPGRRWSTSRRRSAVDCSIPKNISPEHPISFPFLLDEDRRVTKAYGVYHAIGIDALNIAHPATFIVGREGKLRMIYVGMNQSDRMPVQAILEVLRAIPKEAK